MVRTIITHVGTSLLYCEALKRRPPMAKEALDRLIDDLNHNIPYETRLRRFIEGLRAALREYWAPGTYEPQAQREASPGEIASLSLLSVQPDDRVLLFHSDTALGHFCALALAEALADPETQSGFPVCLAETVHLDGLKIVDEQDLGLSAAHADGFVRIGLKSYVNAAWKEYDSFPRQPPQAGGKHQLIFNVTGGYKGVVPIARDLELLLSEHASRKKRHVQCRLCYLYESSDKLIWYDALPVVFDWSKLNLKRLMDAALPDGIPDEEPPPELAVYFEESSTRRGRLQLSALGTVLLELYGKVFP
jgi:hypothetical protein